VSEREKERERERERERAGERERCKSSSSALFSESKRSGSFDRIAVWVFSADVIVVVVVDAVVVDIIDVKTRGKLCLVSIWKPDMWQVRVHLEKEGTQFAKIF